MLCTVSAICRYEQWFGRMFVRRAMHQRRGVTRCLLPGRTNGCMHTETDLMCGGIRWFDVVQPVAIAKQKALSMEHAGVSYAHCHEPVLLRGMGARLVGLGQLLVAWLNCSYKRLAVAVCACGRLKFCPPQHVQGGRALRTTQTLLLCRGPSAQHSLLRATTLPLVQVERSGDEAAAAAAGESIAAGSLQAVALRLEGLTTASTAADARTSGWPSTARDR